MVRTLAWSSSRSPRRSFGLLVLALLALSLLPTSAQAKTPDNYGGHVATEGVLAYEWDCTPQADGTEHCFSTTVTLDVLKQQEPLLCLTYSEFIVSGDLITAMFDESGCAPLARDAVSVPKDLSALSLGATALTLYTYECEPVGPNEFVCEQADSRDVTVALSAAAIAPVREYKDGTSFEDNGCTVSFGSKGEARWATANLTVDGVTSTLEGEILRAKDSYKVRCR